VVLADGQRVVGFFGRQGRRGRKLCPGLGLDRNFFCLLMFLFFVGFWRFLWLGL